MTKYILGLIFILTIFSCTEDDSVLVSPVKDYTSFLAQTTPKFSGRIDNAWFSWIFTLGNSQSMAGYHNGYGICDPNDPMRVVFFGLTSESDLQTRFTLYSPRYNSESEVAQVFGVGKKKLGNFRDDFYLSMYKDGKIYQSNDLNSTNEIEILKTEEFTNHTGKKLRVWFRIDAKLLSYSYPGNLSLLTDGLMIAEFNYFKKEP